MRNPLYTVYLVHTVYCILYTVYCILYTVSCILYTVQCILYTVYCILYIVYCVCVFFPFILDIKFVGRTSRCHTGGRSYRISHPPFCGACLNFSREKDSAVPFPRRLWSRILCTNDLIVLHLLGIFILFFSFLVRKIPFGGIELTSLRVRGLRGTCELPGRLYTVYTVYSILYTVYTVYCIL